MTSSPTLPRVRVLALGGTIAMTPDGAGGVQPTLTGEALVAAVPELQRLARLDVSSFRQVPSPHLQFDDIVALAEAVRGAAADGVRGVVITQGTDTIEETAFALDRLVDGDMPVVVTGAMRHPHLAGADGPANLLAAVQVALSENARGLGCVVVMLDEVHAARFVRKTHTSSPGAFRSPQAGPIGSIVEGRVRIVLHPPPVPSITGVEAAPQARVALATAALGDDGTAIRALGQAGFDGLVVEAMGGGHVGPPVAQALEDVARRIPVVLASRVGAGETLACTYGFVGGEMDLQQRGLVRAGWLDGPKARVLLTLLLRRHGPDRPAIERGFQAWGGGAVG